MTPSLKETTRRPQRKSHFKHVTHLEDKLKAGEARIANLTNRAANLKAKVSEQAELLGEYDNLLETTRANHKASEMALDRRIQGLKVVVVAAGLTLGALTAGWIV